MITQKRESQPLRIDPSVSKESEVLLNPTFSSITWLHDRLLEKALVLFLSLMVTPSFLTLQPAWSSHDDSKLVDQSGDGAEAGNDEAGNDEAGNAQEVDAQADELVSLLRQFQGRFVKIYGAGGVRGLESYQSGFFISGEGHILTSWSTVLDVERPRIVTFDGKKWEGTLVGVDPVTELAVLKMDGDGFPFCELNFVDRIPVGQRVFGVTNLFGIATGNEEASVQKGVIMAHFSLDAKRGRIKTPYRGAIYVLDVLTNNPGATGGALFDLQGHLVGIIGKELRDDSSGIWLNYAIPTREVAESVQGILTGKTQSPNEEMKPAEKPHELIGLGITMIPDVLAKTPAYLDQVTKDSLAERSGLKPNDLIIQVNRQRVDSRKSFESILKTVDRADPLSLLVQRGNQLLTIEIRP